MSLPPYIRNAVDLVLERRKLARREEVATRVFGADDGRPATTGATWCPGSPDREWLCSQPGRGHLFVGTDPAWCVECGAEEDG